MRASGAQSVVLMKRTTSVTLHSSGLLSKHSFGGASVRGLFRRDSKTVSTALCVIIHKTVQNLVMELYSLMLKVYCKSAVLNLSHFRASQKLDLKGPMMFVVFMLKAAFHFFHRN